MIAPFAPRLLPRGWRALLVLAPIPLAWAAAWFVLVGAG